MTLHRFLGSNLSSAHLIRIVMVFLIALPAFAADLRQAEIDLEPTTFEPAETVTWGTPGPVEPRLVSAPIAIPLETPEPFLAVTARWQTPMELLEIRGSIDGNEWSPWRRVEHDPDSSTDRVIVGSLQILPKETSWVQFRVTLGSPDATPDVRAIFISPGASRVTDAPKNPTGPYPMNVSKPPVVSRTEWGCPDGQESPGWTPTVTEVTHFIIHHTVNSNAPADWPAVVRSIFALHTYTNGWGDIGYNFLIDPNGVIYEGRAGGDDVKGAHFSCANSNTMGVAFLGTFTAQLPSEPAWSSGVRLLAWKAEQRAIDPSGSTYHSPTQLVLPNVSAHRDANASTAPGACPKSTECPGNALYASLSALRLDIAGLIASSTPSIDLVSPNGGEIWTVGSPQTITWSATAIDPSSEITVKLSLDGGNTSRVIAVTAATTTTIFWTPTPDTVTTSARVEIVGALDGETVAIDASDRDFAILTRTRMRPIRRP